MLSVKNVTKIYRTKGGVEVKALDGVTIDFPDRPAIKSQVKTRRKTDSK